MERTVGMRFRLRRTVFATIVCAAATLLACVPIVRKARTQDGDRPDDGPPGFLVDYDREAKLAENTARIYQPIVRALNGCAQVPGARLNYYSAVNNHNGLVITGWQAIIVNAQANGQGYVVTLDVNPTLAGDGFGPMCVPWDSDYQEVYQVHDSGKFRYIKSLDPRGLAGKMPGIACF
jgi:hypothetical protein